MNTIRILAGALLAVGLISAEDKAAKADIVDTAVAAKFNTLVAAVKAAGLVDTLKGPGPFTVLAPTDEAFANLPAGALDDLLKPQNKAKLQAVLKQHVIAGSHLSPAVARMSSARTLNGQDVVIRATDGVMMVGSARVVKADVHATNGVIHAIDAVLLPK